MDFNNSQIVATIFTSVFTTLITLLIALFAPKIKDLFDRQFQLFKLKSEHEYEQRKEVKKILSKNKIQLLNSCEELNHRLWNFFGENYPKKWHHIDDIDVEEHYYFVSFIYRFIAVFAWVRKIEKEMIYLDTTFALQEDLEFIKYLRLLPQILYDAELYQGYEYERSKATDHFFRGQIESLAESFVVENNICDFTYFCNQVDNYAENITPVCRFLNGISPEEKRLRWDRLQILHITIMAFLNAFGYDFQYTSMDKIKNITSIPRKSRLLGNFLKIVYRIKLDEQSELKNILNTVISNKG